MTIRAGMTVQLADGRTGHVLYTDQGSCRVRIADGTHEWHDSRTLSEVGR